jgi:SOS-response transcriptional repressor LexA
MSSNSTTDDVYAFVCEYIRLHGYAPSQRLIAQQCHLAQSTVNYHIHKLVKEGRLWQEPGKSRALSLPR